MRPTPETDAFIVQNTTNEGPTGVKWRSHAERLERERDEARAWAEKVERNALQHSIRAENAERERDEARERYNDLLGLKKEPKWYNGREIPIAVEEAAK